MLSVLRWTHISDSFEMFIAMCKNMVHTHAQNRKKDKTKIKRYSN